MNLVTLFQVKWHKGYKMTAKKEQIGGSHYKNLAIQPVEYCHKNGLGFIESSVVKYVSRWRDKNGLEDLKKARHFLDLLIEMETPAEQPIWPKTERRVDIIGSNGNDGLIYRFVEAYQDDFEE